MTQPEQLALFSRKVTQENYQSSSKGVWCEQFTHIPTTHTPGHVSCPACLEARSLLLVPISSAMTFREAAKSFLDTITSPVPNAAARYKAARTLKDYQGYFKTLGVFFGDLRLEEIHIGHIFEYQRTRSTGEGFTRRIGNRKGAPLVPSPAGPVRINAELGKLKKLMKMADCWNKGLDGCYQRFQIISEDIPRALSLEEQERFLALASCNPAWRTLYLYSLVTLASTFSTDEMRTLRIGDVNVLHRQLAVNRKFGKNSFRRRINFVEDPSALWALEQLLHQAKERGATGPQHYLFPQRNGPKSWNPDKHMSDTGLRKQFEPCRDATGVHWFKLNGWRHTAITRLAESGVPWPYIMRQAGHVQPHMTEHYTHISEQAQRAALRRKPPTSVPDMSWRLVSDGLPQIGAA
jgi:integrase